MFGPIRQFVPWFITSIVSLLLIYTSDSPQVEFLRRGFGDVVAIATTPLSPVLKAPRIWQENSRLRKTLADMTLEIARLSRLVDKAERLTEMLEFRSDYDYELIAAEVIGYNPSQGIRTIMVNKGEKEGIKRNFTAIVPSGLVGRVYQVSEHNSAIQLITDQNIGVAGRLIGSREDGIVHAESNGRLILTGIPPTAEIFVGDSLMTSGLGGIFPPNVIIGRVTDTETDPEGWLLNIYIRPAVDFKRIDEVFIVKKSE